MLEDPESFWVPNRGGACTAASVLAALGLLGLKSLPELGAVTLALGARDAYGPPGLLDYFGLPRRRARLDRRIEALAGAQGLAIRSRTRPALPGLPVRPAKDELLVANLAWGQEKPGLYGTWGWNILRPQTYSTGGHSVLLIAVEGRQWLVLDPNHPGLQRWPRPGLVVTLTRIHRLLDRAA